MADDRRYDDREVGLILRRVAELHERSGDKTDARAMTRGEIEEVVAELGMPRALVARAASEVAVRDFRNRPVWWLGGKTDVMFEEVVDGTLDDRTISRMFEVLRRHFGDPGQVNDQGSAKIWSTTTTSELSRHIHLTIDRDEGMTTVRLEERMPLDARTTVALSTVAGFILGILSVIPLEALLTHAVLLLTLLPMIGLGVGAGWMVGRAIWARRAAGRQAQLHAAFAELLALTDGEAPSLGGE